MKEKFLMYMVLLWLVGTIMSYIIAGSWIGDRENNVMNRLMIFTTAKIGAWSIPIPNSAFFVGDSSGPGGIEALIHWDFGFMQGSPLFLLLYLLNIGIMFVLLGIFIGVVTSVFH